MDETCFWTTLDAASPYWSLPLDEDDKHKTAFSVPTGKYEFNITPYGRCNAGETYRRLMDMCLSGLPTEHVLAYMDDMVIFTNDFKTHCAVLVSVLEELIKFKISLKMSKCRFAYESVDLLGFNLSNGGIKPSEHLTEPIRNFKPESKREVMRY